MTITITREDITRAVAAADAHTERDALVSACYAELRALAGPYSGARAREIHAELAALTGPDWLDETSERLAPGLFVRGDGTARARW